MRIIPVAMAVCMIVANGQFVLAAQESGVPILSLADTEKARGMDVPPSPDLPRVVKGQAPVVNKTPAAVETVAAPAVHKKSEVLADAKAAPGAESLAALVAEAVRNNGDVQADREEKQIKLGKAHYERRGYFPGLVGETQFKNDPDNDNHGQSERYYRYSYGVTGDQMIYDFGETKGKVHREANEARASGYEAEVTALDVAYDVTEAYYRTVMYQQVVDFRQKSLEAMKRNAESIADQVAAKAAFGADHKSALSRVAKAEHNLTKAKNGLAVAKRRLLYLLGRDVEGDISIAGDLSFAGPGEKPGLNIEAHPDMKRVRALQDAAASARRAARALLLPRFFFRGLWDYQRGEWNAGETVSNVGPDGYYYQLMAYVKLPIGSEWVAGKGKLREAEANQRKLVHQARQLSEGIKYRVADAQFQVEEAVQGIEVAQKQYEAAREALDLKKQMLSAKKVTQADVAMAEDELAQAEIGRLRALYDAKCAEASLQRAAGLVAGQ